MYAVVSNNIKIYNPTQECRQRYSDMLTFANPEYIKKERMGFWTGNTPKVISLMVSDFDRIEIPFGLLYDVFERKEQYESIVNDVQISENRVNYGSLIKLYDYQEEAVQAALKGRNGVIVAPCASGKTQIQRSF